MSNRSPWKSTAPMGGAIGGAPLPPLGPPPQPIPVGNPPGSAGDPDLLPRLTDTAGVDISVPQNGSIMAFVIAPMTAGAFDNRPKAFDAICWTGDFNLATTCEQYVILVTTIPSGVPPLTALTQRSFFIHDGGSNDGTFPLVRGEWLAPIYVPALRSVVLYVTNSNAAIDPSKGKTQHVYSQWRLL